MTGVVAVVGAGRMGQGIAAALGFGKVEVIVVDLRDRGDAGEAYRAAARAEIRSSLARKVRLGLLADADLPEVLDRIRVVSRGAAADAMAQARLVFEAVPEVLAVKRAALSWIESVVGPETPIASTTSSFLVSRLAEFVARPDRLLNAHWLNPADLMPLVEVSPSAATTPEVVEATCELLSAVGKTPVVCAASPGYIVPRLQALVMNEAVRMVEEGVADAAEIDRAVRIGFGSRFAVLGLLEFIDWGGCDTLFHASTYLRDELGERFAPAPLVERSMADSRPGTADGGGFYDIAPAARDDYRTRRIADFAQVLHATGQLHRYDDLPRRNGRAVAEVLSARPAGGSQDR
ncbi:3-hydroxybutyryl-CoA dehydrogenase [Nocardia farcinica]|uniref:3-hydroxybutyryl-CoA dehydrogenase n=1 Tax=Nocardia farcinica TaxID=37329 RepID=UPI0018934B03|nr:3-hydroxybutyryl-CoA dehydrogenase [Nocardia farcinica]MBF6359746.1 3-hydroxybutyryl-CoA dehydrogenase [Nocardia farcinica]